MTLVCSVCTYRRACRLETPALILPRVVPFVAVEFSRPPLWGPVRLSNFGGCCPILPHTLPSGEG